MVPFLPICWTHFCIVNTSDAVRRPRILSLDGGGVRGLSSLLILRGIMEEIGRQAIQRIDHTPLPCQYFDLMGGSGMGGVIAMMLGRLRMVGTHSEGIVIESGSHSLWTSVSILI